MNFPQYGEIIEEAKTQDFPQYGEIIKDGFQEEGMKEKIPRHLARSTSRAAESILGLTGDILRTAELGARGLEKGASKIREKIGLSPTEQKEYKKPIPGSEELKDLSIKIFGEKVIPQNEKESFIDEIISDSAVLALPIKGKIPFVKAIGTAIAGNVGQEAAKKLGYGEKGQTAAKIGSFFLAGLTGKGNVKKYWNQQYKLAEESVPRRAQIETFRMERKLDNLEHSLKKGIDTPSKSFVEKPLKNIRKKIKKGTANVDELVEMKRDLNEIRGQLYTELGPKQSVKYAQGKINDLANILDREISEYGKANPKFMEHYKNANEAYAGFQQSKKVGRWINRILPISKIGKTGLLVLEALFKPTTLPYTLGGYTTLKGGELLTRMLKNSTLRKYYGSMMKEAVKENKASFLRNLRGLEKEIKENEPEIYGKLASQQKAH